MPKIQLISRDELLEIGDADCRFILRRLDPDIIRESRHRHGRWIPGDRPGMPDRYEVDETEVDKDVLDYVVQDWHGVVGPDGQEAPCTRDFKWMLPAAAKGQILMATQSVNLDGDLAGDLKNLKASSRPQVPGDGSTPGA